MQLALHDVVSRHFPLIMRPLMLRVNVAPQGITTRPSAYPHNIFYTYFLAFFAMPFSLLNAIILVNYYALYRYAGK